ncbi:cold shock domain-containing protein [Nitrogeniibacter aestuarii]|uniref:cold shock domain-containing protein n=1 Tax=Nitrogeniibacter aestuarii TaxID=2815343 RepID=UPI001D104185|nr:cold shock domain-containing protein [Nitrogeniibacter aestuarii]
MGYDALSAGDGKSNGTVKWFSHDKGYGFITCDEDQDYYFSVSDVHGADLPGPGDRVEFQARVGARGLRASRVNIVSRAPEQTRADDRIECPGCQRRIVPRIITNQGQLDHSVCPFCGTTVKDFSLFNILLGKLIKVVAVFVLEHPMLVLTALVLFWLAHVLN